jgi:hypothetical protein
MVAGGLFKLEQMDNFVVLFFLNCDEHLKSNISSECISFILHNTRRVL